VQCLILAGGLGTRMRQFNPALPKSLLPVAGRPFVDWQLEWLASQKVTAVVFCLGHQAEAIRSHVGDGNRWGLRVSYVEEPETLLGTGGAIRLAIDQRSVAERFFVLYGDSYPRADLGDMYKSFRHLDFPVLMAVHNNHNRWDRSNVVFHEGMVTRYQKGADESPSDMTYIDAGLTAVERWIIADRLDPGVASDLSDLYQSLSREGRLAGYEVEERFFEIGSPGGLEELDLFLGNES
jgi:MurNAc alpha-1-phosphate uridylyltransferase